MDYLVTTEPTVVTSMDQANGLKRPHTLKLEDEEPQGKQLRLQAQALLASPDLFKISSPQLEKMLFAQSGLAYTPTPSKLTAGLNRVVTSEEQDNFARGFIEALNSLHQKRSEETNVSQDATVPTYVELQTVTSLPSESTAVSVALEAPQVSLGAPAHSIIKQEDPQTVPQMSSTPPLHATNTSRLHMTSTPPLHSTVPVDLHDQERMKLERKRARNRDAARRCRNRKLDRIATLEGKVRELKNHNSSLSDNADKLREDVCKLKEQIMQHLRCGCQIMVGPNMKI